MSGAQNRRVFVTVGTTSFDALVAAVDAPALRAELQLRGFTSLLIQLGRGAYLPHKEQQAGSRDLAVDFFTFAPASDISHHIRAAHLVISHAGSGSVFETLRAGAPLVVVANEALMDNHQAELAHELARRKHLVRATPTTLLDALRIMDVRDLVPYPPSSPKEMVRSLDWFLGF